MKNFIKLSVIAIMMMITSTAFAQQPVDTAAKVNPAVMPPGAVPARVYYDAQVLMPGLGDAVIGDLASATIDFNGDNKPDLTESDDIDRNNRILPAKFLVNGTWVMGCMLVPDHIAMDNSGKGWVTVAATVRAAGKVPGRQQNIAMGTTAVYWMMMP